MNIPTLNMSCQFCDELNLNDYGTLDKPPASGVNYEENIVSFYNNRPYKQNEFDKVCKHNPIRRLGIVQRCKQCVKKSKCPNPWGILTYLFPILEWLPQYRIKDDLSKDVAAGLTIAVIHIPQGMAYAILSGATPIVGIYMAIYGVIIYILMGTSRHLSMGAFSVACLMTGNVVIKYADPSLMVSSTPPAMVTYNVFNADNSSIRAVPSDTSTVLERLTYIPGMSPNEIVTAVCFMVGIWHALLGLLRVGVLSNVMSESMIGGFTTGTAFIVIASQIKYAFGIKMARHTGVFSIVFILRDVIYSFDNINYLALGITTFVTIALIFYNDFIKPKWLSGLPFTLPIELVAVIAGTFCSTYFKLDQQPYDISTVGHIPVGLPTFTPPPYQLFVDIIGDCLIIAIVSFSINISMAKILANDEYDVDPNKELVASGFANMFASFFQCAPFAASLSRSVVQKKAGGRTQIASLVSLICLIFVLLYIAQVFEPLPHCVLTGIIIAAMKGMLVQLGDFVSYSKKSRGEGMVWIITFIATVLLDVNFGLSVGVCVSLVLVIMNCYKVMVVKLGRVHTTDIYLEYENYDSAIDIPNVLVLRVIGSLNFVNKESFFKKIKKRLKKEKRPIQVLILDMMSVSSVDYSVVKAMSGLHKDLIDNNITLKLVHLISPVKQRFSSCGFFNDFPESYLFPTVHDAVLYSQEVLFNDSSKVSCSNSSDDLNMNIATISQIQALSLDFSTRL